jgi:hypothetical protein
VHVCIHPLHIYSTCARGCAFYLIAPRVEGTNKKRDAAMASKGERGLVRRTMSLLRKRFQHARLHRHNERGDDEPRLHHGHEQKKTLFRKNKNFITYKGEDRRASPGIVYATAVPANTAACGGLCACDCVPRCRCAALRVGSRARDFRL